MGLGARFSPPSGAGRSASQLNAPADSRARPLASVAVTVGRRSGGRRVGAERGLGLGEHRRRSSLAPPCPTPRSGRPRRPLGAVPPHGEPRQHPIGGRASACRGGRHAAASADVAPDVARRPRPRARRGRRRRASRRRSRGAARRSGRSAPAPSAISSFVRPSAASRRTSSSRGESGSTGRSGCRGLERPPVRLEERRDLVDEHLPRRLVGEQDVVAALERDEPRARDQRGRPRPRCRTSSTGRRSPGGPASVPRSGRARRRCRPPGARSGSRPRSRARSTCAGGRRTSASAPRSRRG